MAATCVMETLWSVFQTLSCVKNNDVTYVLAFPNKVHPPSCMPTGRVSSSCTRGWGGGRVQDGGLQLGRRMSCSWKGGLCRPLAHHQAAPSDQHM